MPSVTEKTRSAAAALGAARASHAATAAVRKDRIMLGVFWREKRRAGVGTGLRGWERIIAARRDFPSGFVLRAAYHTVMGPSSEGLALVATQSNALRFSTNLRSCLRLLLRRTNGNLAFAGPLIARRAHWGVAAQSHPRHTESLVPPTSHSFMTPYLSIEAL